MEGIQEFNPDHIVNALLSKGLVILKKADLQEMITSINYSSRLDNRQKYISHKEAISMFNVTDYWLKNQREDSSTQLMCIPGKHKNSVWKYKIQSIQDELDRLTV